MASPESHKHSTPKKSPEVKQWIPEDEAWASWQWFCFSVLSWSAPAQVLASAEGRVGSPRSGSLTEAQASKLWPC